MPSGELIPVESEIKRGYLPGLIGRVAEMHADYYSRHWQFTAFFEARVAREMSDFIERYDARRDCSWSVLVDDRIEASITIDGIAAADQGAQLRWFIASRRLRGQGMGSRLIALAMEFCRQEYRKVYLHSFKGLEAARHLYENAGFKLLSSDLGEQWGSGVEEQRYEVKL